MTHKPKVLELIDREAREDFDDLPEIREDKKKKVLLWLHMQARRKDRTVQQTDACTMWVGAQQPASPAQTFRAAKALKAAP